MKTAPAVHLLLPADPVWRLAISLLAGGSVGSVIAWSAGHGLDALTAWTAASWARVAVWLAGAGLAIGTAALTWWLQGGATHQLAWDGRSWFCARLPQPLATCEPVVALDLGTWILVRALSPVARSSSRATLPCGQARWIAISARTAGASWHPLRVALQAHVVRVASTVDADGARLR